MSCTARGEKQGRAESYCSVHHYLNTSVAHLVSPCFLVCRVVRDRVEDTPTLVSGGGTIGMSYVGTRDLAPALCVMPEYRPTIAESLTTN